MGAIELAFAIEVVAGWLATGAFVIRYARTDWRRRPIGRIIMATEVSLFVLFSLLVPGRLWSPLPRIVWVIALAGLVAGLWFVTGFMYRAQRARGRIGGESS